MMIAAGKAPFEGRGRPLVMALEGKKAPFEISQKGNRLA
jgi:hypothetical protein